MRDRVHLLILGLQLTLLMELVHSAAQKCDPGFEIERRSCIDANECEDPICGDNAECFNTHGSYYCQCNAGFQSVFNNVNFTRDTGDGCRDINECQQDPDICGPNAVCHNAAGSYSCTCEEGFIPSNGKEIFKAGQGVTCVDRDECVDDPTICGENATCINTIGSVHCLCDPGFRLKSGKTNFTENEGTCEDVCVIDKSICGGGGTCYNNGGHRCVCHAGFTNYGYKQSRCTEFSCDGVVMRDSHFDKALPGLKDILTLLNITCLELSESESAVVDEMEQLDGDKLLETLLSIIDRLLSGGPLNDNRKVTALLNTVENALKLIGPLLKNNQTRTSADHTEVELRVERGAAAPQGTLTLSSTHAQLDTHWETAAGDSYPGFTTASLLSYKSLETSANNSFQWVQAQEGKSFQINSKVVTAAVSNKNTAHLKEPVTLTFSHLQATEENHTCVYWDAELDGGAWSERGCTRVESTTNHTVCSCSHLSSFAVLMALYEFKDTFQLQLITWVGLSLSLLCLLLCILTFSLCRSIQCTRTTIHLHLCISLFVADLVFLAGVVPRGNKVGCAFVAGLLHYFFLAAFCWMCLEGVHLFRMLVLVFNTTLRPLYMMTAGYGVPAVIVAISAIANVEGYGTERHCWLSLDKGFIWSFFGPVCVIIVVNAFFFLITVWKLAQKFSTLNPDFDNLRKIKTFTITAVAQLCILGTMWIFGCFQFQENTLAMSYIFTILNSLQGVLVFILHCLLSKQVREEYAKFLSCVCAPQKKKYSEFSTNQSSKSQAPKSVQNTGESQI